MGGGGAEGQRDGDGERGIGDGCPVDVKGL